MTNLSQIAQNLDAARAQIEHAQSLIAKHIAELDAQVVDRIGGRDVTRGELRTFFDAVANPSNWKLPIDCVVTADAAQLAMLSHAVAFFTGSTLDAWPMGGDRWRVTAIGYYNAVGA